MEREPERGRRSAGRGCFIVSTAAPEAVEDPEARSVLLQTLAELDQGLAARPRLAQSRRELPEGADPEALARIVCGVLTRLGVRARAGEPRAALETLAESTVRLIFPEA